MLEDAAEQHSFVLLADGDWEMDELRDLVVPVEPFDLALGNDGAQMLQHVAVDGGVGEYFFRCVKLADRAARRVGGKGVGDIGADKAEAPVGRRPVRRFQQVEAGEQPGEGFGGQVLGMKEAAFIAQLLPFFHDVARVLMLRMFQNLDLRIKADRIEGELIPLDTE